MNVHGYKKHLKELKRLIKSLNSILYTEEQKRNNRKDERLIKELKIEIGNALKKIRGMNKGLQALRKERGKKC